MKKRIETYLPDALTVLADVGIVDDNGTADSKFKGYFSSFGAAIVLSGIKPALAFYANENSDETKKRAKILTAIYKLVVPVNNQHPNPKPKDLLKYYIDNENVDLQLKQKILDAAVALKLALRTYNLN